MVSSCPERRGGPSSAHPAALHRGFEEIAEAAGDLEVLELQRKVDEVTEVLQQRRRGLLRDRPE
eukprot:12894092-Alexandrium_andersonii.AAC.1